MKPTVNSAIAVPWSRAYFKQDLQLHKAWQSASWQYNNCKFYTPQLDFTTAQIVINYTFKYALWRFIR